MAKLSLKLLNELENDQADRFIRFLISGAKPEHIIAITYIRFGKGGKAEDKRRFTFVSVADYLANPKPILQQITLNAADSWNCYIMPTLFRIQPEKGRRGTKDLIAGGSVLWADIDLPEEDWDKKDFYLEKYKHWEIPPSVAISTGRGFHLFWKLDAFIEDAKELEHRNRWLRSKLGGDDCFDAGHILRIPGTRNYKKFWKTPPSVTIAFQENRTWGLTDFQLEIDDVEDASESVFSIQEEDLPEEFLENLPTDLRDKIVNGPAGDSDRSNNDWFVARKLIEIGLTPGQVYSVFMNSEWEVGDKGRNNNSYVVRTIHKAWKENKAVVVHRPGALLQPIIEKHMISRDKHGKAHLEMPTQAMPIIKEACELLLKHGYRFVTGKDDKVPYIITENGTMVRAAINDKQFATLLCNMTLFTPDSRAYRMFATGIVAYATNIALLAETHPWSYINHVTNEWRVLLDHSTARDVLVWRPDGNKEIRQITNGTDGIILTPSIRCHDKAIVWSDGYEWEPGLRELIDLTHDNFPCNDLDKKLLVCLMFALPIAAGLIHNSTLPLLHLTGGSGQGKTGTLKTISAFIHGTTALESGTTGAAINIIGERDFFIPFDDYETLPEHLQQFILTNASGAVRHKVKEVDSDTLASQRAHLMLALTSIGDLEMTTLRRRALQICVSSKQFGRPDYDETHKEKIINRRSMYWTSYIQFICNELLTSLNANTLNAEAVQVASYIGVQEFKPLAAFITLLFRIGKALSKVDERFIAFQDPLIIRQIIDSLGLMSSLAFESNNPVVEPLTQLFNQKRGKKGASASKMKSPIGAGIIESLQDGLYLEAPEFFVNDPALWFRAEDCIVISGMPSCFAVKLSNMGHRQLFAVGGSSSGGQLFSRYIKEGIGTNNLTGLLTNSASSMRFSKLLQLGSSNIYVQYVHGTAGTTRGSAWRFWFPIVSEKDEETVKTEKLANLGKSAEEVSQQAIVDMIQTMVTKTTDQKEKMKWLRLLANARSV